MKLVAAVAALSLIATGAEAAQIILDGSAVVGSTGHLNYNGYSYEAGNIFDAQQGQVAVENIGDGSHWLNPDRPGASYITIDLGSEVNGLQFDLFNTHNGDHNNRGTGLFEILASNTLASDGGNGFTLGGSIVQLVSGTLDPASDAGAYIDAQHFNAGDLSAYRYIQFRALGTIPNGFTNYAYGLNEMRVFSEIGSAVPEPATWAMMIIGFGAAGSMVRSSRRRNNAFA